MAEGRIKWLHADRGFGFIAPDGGGRQVFFHASAVEGRSFEDLREGQRVEYEQGVDPRDPSRQRAERVRALGE
jgi:CspA family cold shock protein